MQHATTMARNTVFHVSHGDEAAASSRWHPRDHPEEEPEERQIAVDPFSLRQFSRLNIDRPLPIPSVSVDHHHHHVPVPHPHPAMFAGASASVPCSAARSPPRLSVAVPPNAPLVPTTRRDAHLLAAAPPPARVASSSVLAPPPRELSRSKSCAGAEAKMDGYEFDVILSSSERKASTPQRWGSDVPLIAAGDSAEDSTDYAVADARGKNGGRGRKGKRGEGAPFTCCLYLPRLARRTTRPPQTAAARASSLSSSPATFRSGGVESDPGTARPSTMSLAVSLEWFDCGSCSTSSLSRLALDGEASASHFDLPLELILGCDNDDQNDLPVNAAFLFDSDGIRKSVLKKGLRRAAPRPSVGKMSTDGSDRISARHVRFSLTSGSAPTSTPS
ncbi:hypothetical protein ABZP36_000870 [Zizania latifolia]